MHFSEIPRIDCTAKDQIDRAIKLARRQFGGYPDRGAAFHQLLSCVWERSSLLRVSPTGREPSAGPALFALKRLTNFARRHVFWIRSQESWRMNGKGCARGGIRRAFNFDVSRNIFLRSTPRRHICIRRGILRRDRKLFGSNPVSFASAGEQVSARLNCPLH